MGNSRLLGLDALRGIAAVLVVWHHALGYLSRGGSTAATAMLEPFDYGRFGVALFFLISGYVIPASFNRGLQGFAVGRTARILPALWLSILFHMVVVWNLSPSSVVLANMLMIAEPLGLPLISLPYWTLQWELAFYIVCSGLFATGRLQSPRVVSMLAAAAIVGSLWWHNLLFLGFMFAGSLVRLKHWRTLALLGAMAMASTLFWAELPKLVALWLAPPMFLVFLRWDAPRPPLVWLGTVSYSLYLFHPTVLHLLDKAGVGGVAFVLVGLCVSIAVAACVYRWVERPFIRAAKSVAPVVTAETASEPKHVNLADVQRVRRVDCPANGVDVAGAAAD